MTNRQPTTRRRWWRVLLAALAAALVTLLGAGTASAVTAPVLETRVGASTPAVTHVVGVHESFSAGQRWGNAPPHAQIASATGVAANMTANIVYRVIRPDEDVARGLVAKDPTATYSIAAHVRSGSRLQTQYISMTRSLDVAQAWSRRSGNRIAQVDLCRVSGNVFDLSTEVGRAMHLPGNPIAQNFARASQELLLQGSVPPSAVRLLGG